MSPREQFLLALFRILDQKAVPYCVLRNYANIYENTSSDIDVAVEPEHVLRFEDCLAQAAAASNHHLVLRARYINYSFVYWHAEGGFVRVDIETEVRWHIFPVLTTKAIVGLRRRNGAFYIPHPRHESAILWSAAIRRGQLSDRYRNQLARLYEQAANPREFQRTLNASFGAIGWELAACQSSVISQTLDRRFWKAARRSIVRNAFRDRPCRRALLRYLAWDLRRLWERIRNPRGISILYASSAQPGRDLKDFFQHIEFLYPIAKSVIHSFSLSPAKGGSFRRLGLRLRAQRLFVLFKGGLFMRFYHLSHDSQFPRVLQTHTRYLFPSRSFIWTEDSQFHTCLGHVETGFMAEFDSPTGTAVSSDWVIRFIASILQQYPARGERRLPKRGAFVVLAGLDASARRAVARNLCGLALAEKRFHRVRCFRWPPHLRQESLFPLRELDNPSDRPQRKNLLRANLVHWLRVRPLLRRNSLVLVDGCDCNYFRDSASAKSSGLAGWLGRSLSLSLRPDLLVAMKTSAAELGSRNSGLSEKELLRQSAVREQLHFEAGRVLQVDAASPPAEIARAILQKIATIVP
jgi:hypothetical protein